MQINTIDDLNRLLHIILPEGTVTISRGILNDFTEKGRQDYRDRCAEAAIQDFVKRLHAYGYIQFKSSTEYGGDIKVTFAIRLPPQSAVLLKLL
jgi:hypothetical protein